MMEGLWPRDRAHKGRNVRCPQQCSSDHVSRGAGSPAGSSDSGPRLTSRLFHSHPPHRVVVQPCPACGHLCDMEVKCLGGGCLFLISTGIANKPHSIPIPNPSLGQRPQRTQWTVFPGLGSSLGLSAQQLRGPGLIPQPPCVSVSFSAKRV